MASSGEEIIELNHVYKIFGDQPRGRALELAKAGVNKNEVQARTDHVVGLTDVNFKVRQGEIFVVMGLSGSGKSTAIRTVNKLHDVTDGEVIVEGEDVQKMTGAKLQAFRRQKMGMVFQHFALFPHRSVIDNVGYGLQVQGVERNQAQRGLPAGPGPGRAWRASPTTTQTSSRAACSSASGWPGPWPPIPMSS